jgi:hypothetical protein
VYDRKDVIELEGENDPEPEASYGSADDEGGSAGSYNSGSAGSYEDGDDARRLNVTANATTAPTYSPKTMATPTNSPTSKIARCAQSERSRYPKGKKKYGRDSGCTDIGESDGDCDMDSDCHGDLVCGTDNCEQGGDSIFDSTDDCCKSPHNEVGNEAIVLLEVGEIVVIVVCVVLIVILLVTYVFKRKRHASKSTPGAVNANAKPVSESDVAIVDITSTAGPSASASGLAPIGIAPDRASDDDTTCCQCDEATIKGYVCLLSFFVFFGCLFYSLEKCWIPHNEC